VIDNYFILSRVEVANKYCPENYSRVLEVGCGSGKFAQNLKSDCEKWGVEVYVPAAENAKSHFNNILIGTYRNVENKLPNEYFDLVVCNDVIEHMSDAAEFMNDIKKKMKLGGYLIGSVPNVRYYSNMINLLLFRDWKYTDGGILDRTHLRFFTKKSLKRLFLESGWIIDTLNGIGGAGPSFHQSWTTYILRIFILIPFMCAGQFDARFRQHGFRLIYVK